MGALARRGDYDQNLVTMSKIDKLAAGCSIAAGEFKAKFLRLMDRVARDRQPLVVTTHGKPIVEIIPACKRHRRMYGYMAGTGEIVSDIISPIDVEWEANR